MQAELAENTEQETNEVEQEAQQESEVEGYEINLGDSPSRDSPKSGNPVVRRLVGQRDKLREQNAEKDAEIEQLRAELNVRNTMTPEAPKYEDYGNDAEYQKAVKDWALGQRSKPQDPAEFFTQYEKQKRQNDRINNHYQKAEKLASQFPDYSEAEEAAIQVLGPKVVEEIAGLSDRSPEIMLYFGRNPTEAQKFKTLLDSNSLKATMELGRLEAKLNIQPRVKTPPPEPDEPLDGGANSPVSMYESRLKKARDAGNLKEAIAIRKQAKADGINLL